MRDDSGIYRLDGLDEPTRIDWRAVQEGAKVRAETYAATRVGNTRRHQIQPQIDIPPALVPVFFLAVWLLASGMISLLTGWDVLARHYRAPETLVIAPDRVFRFRSIGLRRIPLLPGHYNNCMTVGLAGEGLYLAPLAVFRFLHPPLLIPWSAIAECEDGSLLWWRWTDVHLRDGGPRVRLYGQLAASAADMWRQYRNRPPLPMPVA